MQIGLFEIIGGVGVILFLLYYYFISSFDFWKCRKVSGPKPIFLYGTMQDVILQKQSEGDYVKEIYDTYKDEKVVGVFRWRTPILIIRDLDLIKDILIKDFPKFPNRAQSVVKNVEPLSQHLFRLEFKIWRPLRNRLSPVFSSGKLKKMFHFVTECGEELEDYIDKLISKNNIIECSELAAKFTIDVIGSCAFGLQMNAISDENSIFRNIGKKIMTRDYIWRILATEMKENFPWIYEKVLYPFYIFEKDVFFLKLIKDTFEHRDKNNIFRNDFIDCLRELRDNSSKMENIEISDELLAAQAYVFFTGGFHTSSTTICNSLYELAKNQDIQNKLREEVKEKCVNNKEGLTYEIVKDMKYLDNVVKETLRKYPAVMYLMRKSNENYTLDGTDITIPKNQIIWIPIYGIQRDPDLFPNPDKFDPERFNLDVSKLRHPMAYLPFGDGPRNCIGYRFAFFQVRVGIINIIKKYKVEVCKMTVLPSYTSKPTTFLYTPAEDIYLQFHKLES